MGMYYKLKQFKEKVNAVKAKKFEAKESIELANKQMNAIAVNLTKQQSELLERQ